MIGIMSNRFGVQAPAGLLDVFRRHQQELAFWERHEAEFTHRYAGSFVVARDGRVVASGDWEDIKGDLDKSASVRYYARPREIWIL